jgi:hypothetical protein
MAHSLKGPSWTNILMAADFQAYGDMLLLSLAQHQSRHERKFRDYFVVSMHHTYSRPARSSGRIADVILQTIEAQVGNGNGSLRMS